MGSGTKRKRNDQTIIRIPKASVIGIIKDSAEQAAELCKVSFQLQINNKDFAIKNTPLELQWNGGTYSIFLSGTKIGQLTDAQSKMVARCEELGVRYKGMVVEDKGVYYARFIRVI